MKKAIFFCVFATIFCTLHAENKKALLQSKSRIDWKSGTFSSDISLSLNREDFLDLSGKANGEALISLKLPELLKDPLLGIYIDSRTSLGEAVFNDEISMEYITDVIENGKNRVHTLSLDGKTLNTSASIDVKDLMRTFVVHKYPYTPKTPVDIISSRPFSGIIIDATGDMHVHGEYVSSAVYPCFFPIIRSEDMERVYEKNMTESDGARERGIVHYDWKSSSKETIARVGKDPLYIRATAVYGRNRTDPVISREDALKILSVKENVDLLRSGKIAILLDKDKILSQVSAPVKGEPYYAVYGEIKKYLIENPDDSITVDDGLNGIVFSVNLKFIPDSSELLPNERPRITKIAEMLREVIKKDENFTILVEGHTADAGKPRGEMQLSIERTRTVMKALIREGLPSKIFSYKGYGATKPVASNDTEEGKKQNRRVDITARPRTSFVQSESVEIKSSE